MKGGILKFKDNILGHLRKGLMGWLFGALAEGGVELPDTFDLKGIIKLLASIFGLTWANIRNRIVKQIGEKAMAAVEKGVEIFQIIAGQGVGGAVADAAGEARRHQGDDPRAGEGLRDHQDHHRRHHLADRPAQPGGGVHQGLQADLRRRDVLREQRQPDHEVRQHRSSTRSPTSSRGNVSGVVNKIEDVLGQMVPIIIGFLASVIGLGGIGQKIREIVETLQKPVNKALDFVIKTGLKLAGPIIRGIKGISGKVKAKVAAGKAWVKGKVEAGKKWVKGKAAAGLDALRNAIFRAFGRRRPVPMMGRTHHLYVEKHGAEYRIMLASTAAELTARIDRALKNPKAQGNSGITTHLGSLRKKVTTAETAFLDAKQVGDQAKLERDTKGELEATVNEVERETIRLGTKWDITELTGGKYVLDDKVHPDYEDSIRDEFYKGFNKIADKTHRARVYEDQRKLVPPGPMSDKADIYMCPGFGRDAHPCDRRSPTGRFALDHGQAVVRHWNDRGRFTTQDERVEFLSALGNLSGLCTSCNGRKSGREEVGEKNPNYLKDVGPGFFGPNGMR